MTYEELKSRLVRVESALQTISNYSKISKEEKTALVEKFNIIKENIEKRLKVLKEAVEFPKGKEKDAAKFAEENPETPVTIKSEASDAPEDIEFDRTKMPIIATAVGKALAKALIRLGDEIARMKAHRLQVNSFDVLVTYKGEGDEDEFSFHIENGNLHIADFSYNEKLVEIGVKPSGDPIINEFNLIEAFINHFRNLEKIRSTNEDIDVGHEDNEPSMIKKQLYRIIKDAENLYKALGKYEGNAEVDFPSWWQNKITKSQSYLSGAHDYLDSEENVKDSEVVHGPLSYDVNEGTDMYEGDKFSMKRFAGPNGIALQITAPKLKGGGYEYIQIDGSDVKEFARAAVHVAQEFHDIDRQLPVNEEKGEFKKRDKNEAIEDQELPKDKYSVRELQKVYKLIVDKMLELNDIRKEKGLDHMYMGGSEPGKHSVRDHLVSLTRKKRQVEDALEKAVANVGKGQELNEFVGEKLEKRNQPLYDELVPSSGNSDFIEGEILRAINRIVYRWYNDGDFFYKGYGAETAGPAHAFLTQSGEIDSTLRSTLTQIFNKAIGAPEDGYERLLKFALEKILDYIESKEGNYTKSNEDMFNYESEFEDEEDDYDDYDDYNDEEEEDEDYYNEGKEK
tara:strand:- start:9398 stop:11266 length:1869 start_codon:yes stop_codon:yes gene_type:complete